MLPDTLSKYIKVSEKSPKLFVQLYGKPVTGKTTGALTFPNPLVVNFDNNLPAGVKQIPMYDDAFVDGIVKRSNPRYPANRRDALKAVMIDLCREMPEGSTIIVDSMSRVESAYNMQEDIEPKELTNKGEVDGFKMFRKRLTFYEDLFVLAQAARAHVVFIFHQQQERDEKGDLTKQIKPGLLGQMADKSTAFFSTVLQAGIGPKGEYLWRVRPTQYEPARVITTKPLTVDFIPQNFAALVELQSQ